MEKITFKKIKRISDRIARKYRPEKIILFGSFAWGKPDEDSDIDFLIIKNTWKRLLQRELEVRKIINGELPVDLLVRTFPEVKIRLKLGYFFYQDIIEKGIILYEKSKR